jgi:hypothetical protein
MLFQVIFYCYHWYFEFLEPNLCFSMKTDSGNRDGLIGLNHENVNSLVYILIYDTRTAKPFRHIDNFPSVPYYRIRFCASYCVVLFILLVIWLLAHHVNNNIYYYYYYYCYINWLRPIRSTVRTGRTYAIRLQPRLHYHWNGCVTTVRIYWLRLMHY